MNSIRILDDNLKINSAFTKANYELLSRHYSKFYNKLLEEKKQLLKELWILEYNAELQNDIILFNRKQDMTMFLLRWS
jgi:hypothetical protein